MLPVLHVAEQRRGALLETTPVEQSGKQIEIAACRHFLAVLLDTRHKRIGIQHHNGADQEKENAGHRQDAHVVGKAQVQYQQHQQKAAERRLAERPQPVAHAVAEDDGEKHEIGRRSDAGVGKRHQCRRHEIGPHRKPPAQR